MNHIGYAVPDMAAALDHWRNVMGATAVHDEIVMEEMGLKIVFVDTPTASGIDGTQVELIQPIREGTAVGSFLEKNPLGGQHHVCFEVPDIAVAREYFEGLGKRILGPTRIGAHGTSIFFVHPKDMQGMLTEIMETPKDGAAH